MSDNNQTVQTGWSSVQVYTLSAICLLIGITVGYLVRGSTAAKAPTPPAAMSQSAGEGTGGSMGQPPTPEAMKRMADKQVAPLMEQLKSKPNDPEIMGKIAHYYMVASQYKDAAIYYEKTVAVKPTAENWTNLANAYYYSESPDKAMEALNQALKIDPKSADALFNLGVLKWQVQGDSKGAIQCWETLIKTNPNHPQLAQVKQMIAKAKQHANMPPGSKTDKPAM
jgi:cytochrome c-type biogenesis protein CcmH/NrfG